jgi:outer membrane protein TolC
VPDSAALRAVALDRRPDLKALAARVSADRAALGLAGREYYPDFEVMAGYDTFWTATQQQAQIGVRVNLPVRLERRAAAVQEAEAQLAQRVAQLNQQTNQVAFEVEQAYAQVRESEQAVRLYREKILPAARENVKSAQSAYVTGKTPFVSLIEAQRSLVDLRDRSYAVAAEYQRRLAALERAVGGAIPSRSERG